MRFIYSDDMLFNVDYVVYAKYFQSADSPNNYILQLKVIDTDHLFEFEGESAKRLWRELVFTYAPEPSDDI